ncbi:MAG: hypothetical protein K6F46_01990 [Desulfovibrio sp.]|nr:hypothetical protein [Desulfovibrio sp.]
MTLIFNEQLLPKDFAALLLSAPLPAQKTRLHYFLRGQYYLRLIMEVNKGRSFNSLIPRSCQKKLFDFLDEARSKIMFLDQIHAFLPPHDPNKNVKSAAYINLDNAYLLQ